MATTMAAVTEKAPETKFLAFEEAKKLASGGMKADEIRNILKVKIDAACAILTSEAEKNTYRSRARFAINNGIKRGQKDRTEETVALVEDSAKPPPLRRALSAELSEMVGVERQYARKILDEVSNDYILAGKMLLRRALDENTKQNVQKMRAQGCAYCHEHMASVANLPCGCVHFCVACQQIYDSKYPNKCPVCHKSTNGTMVLGTTKKTCEMCFSEVDGAFLCATNASCMHRVCIPCAVDRINFVNANKDGNFIPGGTRCPIANCMSILNLEKVEEIYELSWHLSRCLPTTAETGDIGASTSSAWKRKSSLHEHRLQQRAGSFRHSCDGCSKRGIDPRWHCVEGCDYDLCDVCINRNSSLTAFESTFRNEIAPDLLERCTDFKPLAVTALDKYVSFETEASIPPKLRGYCPKCSTVNRIEPQTSGFLKFLPDRDPLDSGVPVYLLPLVTSLEVGSVTERLFNDDRVPVNTRFSNLYCGKLLSRDGLEVADAPPLADARPQPRTPLQRFQRPQRRRLKPVAKHGTCGYGSACASCTRLNVLWNEAKAKASFSPDLYLAEGVKVSEVRDQWAKLSPDYYVRLSLSQGFVEHAPDVCGWIRIVDEDGKNMFDMSSFNIPHACTNCSYNMCRKCKCKFHGGDTCSEAKEFRDSPTGKLIFAVSKPCPRCDFPTTKYHGHGCHHIGYGSAKCQCRYDWCYACGGEFRQCGCDYSGSSFCSNQSIKDHIEYSKGEWPVDDRCGCAICPDCQPGKPCIVGGEDCDCVVCNGGVDRKVLADNFPLFKSVAFPDTAEDSKSGGAVKVPKPAAATGGFIGTAQAVTRGGNGVFSNIAVAAGSGSGVLGNVHAVTSGRSGLFGNRWFGNRGGGNLFGGNGLLPAQAVARRGSGLFGNGGFDNTQAGARGGGNLFGNAQAVTSGGSSLFGHGEAGNTQAGAGSRSGLFGNAQTATRGGSGLFGNGEAGNTQAVARGGGNLRWPSHQGIGGGGRQAAAVGGGSQRPLVGGHQQTSTLQQQGTGKVFGNQEFQSAGLQQGVSVREEVFHIYQQYNPSEMYKAERNLTRYAGQEQVLLQKLRKKYVDPANSRSQCFSEKEEEEEGLNAEREDKAAANLERFECDKNELAKLKEQQTFTTAGSREEFMGTNDKKLPDSDIADQGKAMFSALMPLPASRYSSMKAALQTPLPESDTESDSSSPPSKPPVAKRVGSSSSCAATEDQIVGARNSLFVEQVAMNSPLPYSDEETNSD